MEFSILGPLRVVANGRRMAVMSARQRAVLAALLLCANRPVTIDQLVDAVWGETAPVTARRLVQTYVWRLRQLTAQFESGRSPARIASYPDCYLLHTLAGELDAATFERLTGEADCALAAGDTAGASLHLTRALGLWRGDPLTDTSIEGPLLAEVRRLSELRRHAVDARVECDLRQGRHGDLVAELTALIVADPLYEPHHAHLMVALTRAGRRAEALQAFAAARERLVADLGVEPGDQLQELHLAILRGDHDLRAHTEARAGPTAPQVGAKGHQVAAPYRHTGRSTVGPVVPRQLSAPIPYFTGRVEELTTLTGLLATAAKQGAVMTAVLSGAPGVGKTSLAVHWAHQVAHRFPDGQLFINLRGYDPVLPPMAPAEAAHAFLEALGVPAECIPADFGSRIGLYRSLLADQQILVVLDNARDACQVRPLLPGSCGNAVVITSRGQLLGLAAADGADLIALPLLTHRQARELLTRKIGVERARAEPQAVDALVALCARLPLALNVAAAQGSALPGRSLTDLVEELRDAERRLDALDVGDPSASVRAVFSSSYQSLATPTARLFRLLGAHPGPAITVPAAASLGAVPAGQSRAILAGLSQVHLVSEYPAGRYACHDLLRDYAAELSRDSESLAETHEAVGRAVDHYLHSAWAAGLRLDEPVLELPNLGPPQPGVIPESPASSGEALAWFQAERPVLLAMADHAGLYGLHRQAWLLTCVIDRFLDRCGHWRELVVSQVTGLDAARRMADRGAQARSHLNLGRGHTRLGNLAEADRHYHSALELYGESGDGSGLAVTHLGLCLAWQKRSQPASALRHAREALRLYQALGHQNGQANAYNDIGWLQGELGDYRRALSSCQLALNLSRESGDRYCQACAWDSIGYAHHHLGAPRQAVACYHRALSLFQQLGDLYNQAQVLTHLGDAQQALGNEAAAGRAFERALAILEELGDPGASLIRARFTRPCELDSRRADGSVTTARE